MPNGDRVRVEIGFEGGQVIGGFVATAAAEELERALHEDGPRVVAQRGEKLDATLADAQRRRFDALGLDRGPVLETGAEEMLVRPNRFVEIRDGDADVVDASRFHPGDAIRCRPGSA